MAKDSNTAEIDELRKKLEESPDSLVFAPLADAYRKAGKLGEAYDVCAKGLQRHPTYTSARVVLGRIYQEQGKSEQAGLEFKKVLEMDSENLMAHSLLGAIYMEAKDYQGAIEEFQKVLTLNPDDETTQNSLKQAIEKAAGEQQSVKSQPKGPETLPVKTSTKETTATLTIAELYLKQGHLEKAIEVFQELLANDPQNLMLRQKLAEIVDRQKKETSAGATPAKLKKSEFIQPPDQKEDSLIEETKVGPKKQEAVSKEDDSKFTSEDILQVMRRGGKDDVVVEEKPSKPVPKAPVPTPAKVEPAAKVAPPANSTSSKLTTEQLEGFKGVLAELSRMEGIMRCFLIQNDGIIVVSMGETSNNDALGKQAAGIFQSTNLSVSQLKQGTLQQVLVTADNGNILLVSLGQVVLTVLANSKINLGLLRLSLDAALKKVEKFL